MNDAAPGGNDRVDVDAVLDLGTGISASEREQVVAALGAVESRLRSLDRSLLRIEAWVKNRDDNDQIVYLAVRAGNVDIVAHDQSRDFGRSLLAARNDLRRQLTDAHDRRNHRR
ncbi:MAG: hypothetical protein WBM50_21615 [Acidimicrobiales bacterium]